VWCISFVVSCVLLFALLDKNNLLLAYLKIDLSKFINIPFVSSLALIGAATV
jgi:hypothetical protein